MSMDYICDYYKSCCVKITTSICGGTAFATGIIYITSNYQEFDYILTAKHTFLEEGVTEIDEKKISFIEIQYWENSSFKKLDYIPNKEVASRLIKFEFDFIIIKIKKKEIKIFPKILVADEVLPNDEVFYSWAIFHAQPDELNLFHYKLNDFNNKRFKLDADIKDAQNYHGISGSGIFSSKAGVLYGIVGGYTNLCFENNIIDCCRIPFEEINKELALRHEPQLKNTTSQSRRIVKQNIVDIKQAVINNVSLDLAIALKRVKNDISDDWYCDPLHYVDLLNWDYLYKQLQPYFDGETYEANSMELFFIPKKEFNLRQALVGTFIDKIIYTALVGVLAPKLDANMIPNVYSARFNYWQENHLIINGVEQWKKMKYQLLECTQKYDCVIEIDLLNYYDNINKDILFQEIKKVCETPNEIFAAEMLYNMIKKFSSRNTGLPQNCDASSLLATFYLNQVDVFMHNLAPDYYRFMDDIRIFCTNKYEARKLFLAIETELRRCELSINTQKSNIIELKSEEDKNNLIQSLSVFDLELNKIDRFSKSHNYVYLNEAFHLNIKILDDCLDEDFNSSKEAARKLRYSLSIITKLGKKKISLSSNNKFQTYLKKISKNLDDAPWLTPQVCNILYLIPFYEVKKELWEILSNIVLNDNLNIYTWQTYQIWMLFAYHKYKSNKLIKYATRAIESNDETQRPVVAAMMLYLGAINDNYRRIILRKFGEGFTHGYFQNRIALIIIRAFPTEIIPIKNIEPSLSEAHPFLYRKKEKELVYIPGIEEENDSEEMFEQIYSL